MNAGDLLVCGIGWGWLPKPAPVRWLDRSCLPPICYNQPLPGHSLTASQNFAALIKFQMQH